MESVLPAPVGQTGPPNIRLSLSNRPENVALVRQMLAGLAEAVGLDGVDLNDISTAATEACNNVVLHAYEGGEGPLEIDVYAGAEAIEVVVRDRGGGIPPQIGRPEEGSGIGLSVIQTLARRAEFRDTADEGTEVRMEFATPPAATWASPPEDGFEMPGIIDTELAGAMEISMLPPPSRVRFFPACSACLLRARTSRQTASPMSSSWPMRSPHMSPERSPAVTSASAFASSPTTWSCASRRCARAADTS